MSNKFHVIDAKNREHYDLLTSMHKLRYEVFHKELKWTTGLSIVRDMEFDDYDLIETKYIVRVDEKGQVDAACRIIPTNYPYMLKEHYPEFIETIPVPNSPEIWEISRFCASMDARKSSHGHITGQLIAALIEFGLSENIQNYIALATDTVVPIIRRIAGWDPKPLGSRMKTPDDHAYSVIYTVSEEMLQKIRTKHSITAESVFEYPFSKAFSFPCTHSQQFVPANKNMEMMDKVA